MLFSEIYTALLLLCLVFVFIIQNKSKILKNEEFFPLAILPNNFIQTNLSDCSSVYPYTLISQYSFPSEMLMSQMSRKTQPKLMKSHIVYGIKFICYRRRGEGYLNILGDQNVNQFL